MVWAAASAMIFTSKTLTVFAASSLKETFTECGKQFEKSNPDVKVVFSFAGSQTLAAQIRQGAPADVFAAASAEYLRQIDLVTASSLSFARNELVIVVRKGFGSIHSVNDLDKASRIVLAGKTVPAGKYAEEFLDLAGKKNGSAWLNRVKSRIVSREVDVRAVLTKVQIGEADAGIVYVTDGVAAGNRVQRVVIPSALNRTAVYAAGVVSESKNAELAGSFVRFLGSESAQKVLRKAGFLESARQAIGKQSE